MAASLRTERMLEKDRLMGMRKVAELLGVPLYTARAWGRAGVFPSIVLRGRRFVRVVAFHRWLKEHERGGRNPA